MATKKEPFVKFFNLSIILVLSIAINISSADAQQHKPGEYDVKAAFIYNFLKFIDWPDGAFVDEQNSMSICVLGKSPFGSALDFVREEKINNRKIIVKHYNNIHDLGRCHILFISRSEGEGLTQILENLKGLNILTISDNKGFAQQGVVINFYIEEDKVRFEINQDAANRSGLKISSKLLSLAKIVRGAGR
ncbi:MAG: hypothetical protein A2Z47_06915 [Thermodesulfovibrio sp. RBG_19FT_COMBO_42_12]|nr:MAG: hypothetical protein A2Z47_06915 [Thermodesulfovibrio sp. RBG_19FT_COMBO_42_12]